MNKGIVHRADISAFQYYLGIIVLLTTVVSSLLSIGYTLRKVDEFDRRITNLENNGSTKAQLTEKDIQWLRSNMNDLGKQLDRMESKLDRHMNER